jgi:Uma2 family endonuclease
MVVMRTPGWYDEFPEIVTEEQYEALPEEVCRTIEVVHGRIIRCESPTPRHNLIARRLAAVLEDARDPEPCLMVGLDIDVVLWRVPRFTFRRPDAVVYRCREDETTKVTADGVELVVEVTSPSTARDDLIDKRAEYAAAGIPAYLVLILDEKAEVEEVREFHLDAGTREYVLYRVRRGELTIGTPVRAQAPFAELTRP